MNTWDQRDLRGDGASLGSEGEAASWSRLFRAGGGVQEEVGQEATVIPQVPAAAGLHLWPARLPLVQSKHGEQIARPLALAVELHLAGSAPKRNSLAAAEPTLCEREPPASSVSQLLFSPQSAFLLNPLCYLFCPLHD